MIPFHIAYVAPSGTRYCSVTQEARSLKDVWEEIQLADNYGITLVLHSQPLERAVEFNN